MSSSSTSQGTTVDVTMPQMGVSVAEGTIVEWKKQPGDWIEADETICEISTDKIDTDVPSPAAGRVVEVLVPVGETVEVGAVLARIETDARPGEAHAAESGDGAASAPPGEAPDHAEVDGASTSEATAALEAPGDAGELVGDSTEQAGAATPPVPRPAGRGGRRYSPVVQRIAAEHDVDLDQVPGTGRGGRVRKQDVLAFVESVGDGAAAAAEEPPMHIESPYRPDEAPPPARTAASATAPGAAAPAPPVPAGAYQPPAAAPLARMRRSIGEHMKRSLDTAATCTTWIEVDMARVEQARRERRLTALPFVARCTIDALREFPTINAWLEDDKHTQHEEVNLGIAVSLGDEGLIVPVIRSAQDLSVEGLGKRIRDIARRARDKALAPDDVQAGTFTITNPGQYGSVMATPVINQPQVAILDIEATIKRPVVITAEDGTDSIAIRPICVLGLSWDHRALDGALAAQFLAEVKRRVESWDGG